MNIRVQCERTYQLYIEICMYKKMRYYFLLTSIIIRLQCLSKGMDTD